MSSANLYAAMEAQVRATRPIPAPPALSIPTRSMMPP
jgi:hypothetical protein